MGWGKQNKQIYVKKKTKQTNNQFLKQFINAVYLVCLYECTHPSNAWIKLLFLIVV